jgi:VWFA-related protein
MNQTAPTTKVTKGTRFLWASPRLMVLLSALVPFVYAFVTFVTVGTGAQEQKQQLPRFRGGANLVRVDAYATVKGQPVKDLTAADFEVLEDGVPQKVDTFEHVEIHGRVPQTERREPNTVREARAMAEDPRSRVFVIFLDTYHTSLAGSHAMQRVLADMLERLIGPDDLFAVMTPRMSPTEITLARRTMTLERELAKYWYWGQRDNHVLEDEEDRILRECDSGDPEIVARRHEKLTLDALTDLATYLRGLREERKAVIAITSGWVLYQPNRALMERTDTRPLSIPSVGTGPDGRPMNDPDHALAGGFFSRRDCEMKRIQLAGLDLRDEFRALLDVANGGNVSFYPLDARGLAAADKFDMAASERIESGQIQILEQKIGAGAVEHYAPLNVDQGMLRQRLDVLRTLAIDTDGIAIVDTNDLHWGARRIVDDLSSYYLLGYYSTNAKLDGKFRSIKVRMKRPGVAVRARRGYKAPTPGDLTRGRELSEQARAEAPPPAFQAAMAALAAARPDSRLLTSVSWIAAPIDDAVPGAKSRLWVVGELDAATAKAPEWAGGATADVLVTAEDGALIAETSEPVSAPVRAVTLSLPDARLGPGEYALRLRVQPKGGGLPCIDTLRFTVPEQSGLTGKPLVLRRGLSTGVEYVATADPRFRRSDRLRIDIPLLGAVQGAQGELLDRNGHVIPIPVQATTRNEGDWLYWASAEAALAPLAPGVYAIRTIIDRGAKEEQVVTAFRVVP